MENQLYIVSWEIKEMQSLNADFVGDSLVHMFKITV